VIVIWVDKKLSQCMQQRHVGSRGATSLIHNLCTRRRWVAIFIPWYLMNRMLQEHQRQLGCFG